MKAAYKYFLMMGFIALFATACEEEDNGDDDTSEIENELLIGDETYPISQGLLENYGNDTAYHEGTNIDLTLFTDGLEVALDSANGIDSVSGSGYIFWVELFTSDEDSLMPGTYSYSTERIIGTFELAYVTQIADGEEVNDEYQITNGVVEISTEAGSYVVDGILTADGSITVEVDYTGAFSMVDYR